MASFLWPSKNSISGLPRISVPTTAAEKVKSKRKAMMPKMFSILPNIRSALFITSATSATYETTPKALPKPDVKLYFFIFEINDQLRCPTSLLGRTRSSAGHTPYLSKSQYLNIFSYLACRAKSAIGATECGAGYQNRTGTSTLPVLRSSKVEQVTGIGPVPHPWEGYVLPLNHTCTCYGGWRKVAFCH